jgi:hypothetical protein
MNINPIGIIDPIKAKPPVQIIVHPNPPIIANNICPALILAANRSPKEIALAE